MALFGRWLSRRTDGRQRKASAVGALIASQARSAWLNLGTPRWTARAYERLAEEGARCAWSPSVPRRCRWR